MYLGFITQKNAQYSVVNQRFIESIELSELNFTFLIYMKKN